MTMILYGLPVQCSFIFYDLLKTKAFLESCKFTKNKNKKQKVIERKEKDKAVARELLKNPNRILEKREIVTYKKNPF